LYHQARDIDLAVWVESVDDLAALGRARGAALRTLLAERGIGVAHHQLDVFLIEPRTNAYLGRLCDYAQCPKGKPACSAPDCGRAKFLQQHEDFVFHPDALDESRIVRLYQRAPSPDDPVDVAFNGLGLRLWVKPDDFAATADFYAEAMGLKCTWRSDEQGVATYELGFGPTVVVERAEPTPEHAPLLGRFTGFSFEVPDITAAYAALQARGVPFQGPPERQSWGGTMAFFTDPGGNSHTLLQQPGKG
ncbi:MAG TPA: VOC family protein, partial [Caulobacteraceae bacterium]|nr:VOC family protein [Caulobacteraceae bacterium]